MRRPTSVVTVVIAPVLFMLSERRNHDAIAAIGQNLLKFSAIICFFPCFSRPESSWMTPNSTPNVPALPQNATLGPLYDNNRSIDRLLTTGMSDAVTYKRIGV